MDRWDLTKEICTTKKSSTLLEHGILSPDKDSLLNALSSLFSSLFYSPPSAVAEEIAHGTIR